jgi:hypothetical protein
MDNDMVERMVRARRLVDHLLECRPVVVECGCTGLGEDL